MRDSDDYMESQRRALTAEGRLFEARQLIRIPLRACYWAIYDEQGETLEGHSGVALPDGRLIFAEQHGIATYSSEQALTGVHPKAKLNWVPSADKTVNHVMELPDAPHH